MGEQDTTTVETPKERMTRKVAALLAKAEATNYPEEAHAFTSKAEQIIAQYGIDSAMLAAQEDTDGTGPEIVDRFIMIHPPYTIDAQLMLCGLASAMRVRVIILGKVGKARKVHAFGTQADMDRFMILWNSLRIQADGLVSQVEANMFESAKTARCNFFTGFRHIVVERVKGTESHAESTAASGASLVLASQAEAVTDSVNSHYPRLGKAGAPVKRLASASYYAGQRAGATANIGQTAVA